VTGAAVPRGAALGDVGAAQGTGGRGREPAKAARCDAFDDVAVVNDSYLLGGRWPETCCQASVDQGGYFGAQAFVGGAADDLVALALYIFRAAGFISSRKPARAGISANHEMILGECSYTAWINASLAATVPIAR